MTTPRWETDQREVYRATFDEDPDAYDRTRPVAPEPVFDELVGLAGLRPGSSVLEIGPGTGQATRRLAERGLRVLAVELGPALADRARRNLAAFPDVDVVTSSFEAWDPGGATFDAVFACNSFHWVDPEVRFVKSAAVLGRGGHLAVLATPWVVPEDADRFWWDVQDDYAAIGAERIDPAIKHPDRIAEFGDIGAAIRASGLFDEPTVVRRRFDVTFTADDYATNLSTQSGTREFRPAARAELIVGIKRRIEERGGTVTAHLLAVLTIGARR
jgi:SAM-dependent methyltransferase